MPSFPGPLRVSPDGRYFTDQSGEPLFWLGDTQWELCRSLQLDDVCAVLEDRRRKGFSVLQVMLTGVGDGTGPNVAGDTPWRDDNPDTPNERYFARVDAVLELVRDTGVAIVLGVYHQLHAPRLTAAKGRAYARWIARRYRDAPHLVWAMYPRADETFLPVVRELAAGLQEGDDGRHLITVHPDPSPASSSFLPPGDIAGWLGFHSIQTWADTHLIVPMVRHDYQRHPTKPVVLAEGAYEAGGEYGFDVSPLWVRRQAYSTVLAGGHHSYGHNDLWRLPGRWREALDAPGARQLTILRDVLTSRSEWWNLTPDQSLIADCGASDSGLNVAARAASGDWALIYLGGRSTVRVGQMGCLSQLAASWIDPSTGERSEIGTVANSGDERFAPPDGWEDALLLLGAQ